MKPPRDPRRAGLPDDRHEHAESDLSAAKALATVAAVLPEQVCFHAQQAAEKALKAVMLHLGAEFRLTDDIEKLVEAVEATGLPVPPEFEDAGSLTMYAVDSRYPGGWGEISSTDVGDAIALAEGIVLWATRLIGGADRQ